MSLKHLHNGRMKLFLLFFLLLTPLAHAQKNLSSIAFQSSIRPVLSGILSDFYQMVSLFPDFPNDLAEIVDELDEIHGDKELLKEKCPRILDKNCLENINNLRSRLQSIQGKTLKLISEQTISTNLHMNPIGGMRITSEFQVELDELKGELDNASLIMKAGASQKKETFTIIKQIDELSTYISLTVVEYVPFAYKEDFRHFYFNFIHPLQQQISKRQNYEFFNRNLNSLNFALNLLNQNLTKRNKKTPEGMAPYLSLIHNRWNSILRYYF